MRRLAPIHSPSIRTDVPCRGRDAVAFAAVLAVLSGVLFGAFDIFRHVAEPLVVDVFFAFVYATVAALPVVIGGAGLLLVILRLTKSVRTTPEVFAVLTTGTGLSLFLAVLFLATRHEKSWMDVLAIITLLPMSFGVYQALRRATRWLQPAPAMACALAGILAVVVGMCGYASQSEPHAFAIWRAWPVGLATGVLVLGIAISLRRPRAARLALLAALIAAPPALIACDRSDRAPAVKPGHSADRQPNVVLLILDTTRRDYLGCYGNTQGLTPELDKVAREGVVYDDAVTAAPWTLPSHASMFTGLYPITHGCTVDGLHWLDDRFETIAERLGQKGYDTLSVTANWVLDAHNLLQGFERRVDLYFTYRNLALFGMAEFAGWPQRWVDKGAMRAPEQAARLLGSRGAANKPFFLFVNLLEPHEQYLPPHDARQACLPEGVGYVEATRFASRYSSIVMHATGHTDARARTITEAMYRAEVAYQDQWVGRLFDVLRERCDLDNTLVIITADHGENLGEAGRWGHMYAVNHLLTQVPLMIRFPKRFPAGRRIAGLCQLIDLVPTIEDMLGEPAKKGAVGRSLAPDIFTPREFAMSEVYPHFWTFTAIEKAQGMQAGMWRYGAVRRALRSKNFDFIWSSAGDHALYDIARDPGETHNLIKLRPDLAGEMGKALSELVARQPVYQRPSETKAPHPVSNEAFERLKSLGYLQ